MASIPTVPGSAIVQTPEASVKMNFGALNAPNQARSQFADSVGDVGRMLGQFGQQMQAVKNFGITADADRRMRETTAEFQASRLGRTDEDNWVNEWKEKAAATRQMIFDQGGLGPDLKRQLDNNLKNWGQANAIEVATIARKQTINRAVERASGAAMAAIEDGSPGAEEAISAALDPLVKLGAAYPEKVANMKTEMLQRLDDSRVNTAIMNNAAKAVELLEMKEEDGSDVFFKHLNPQMRRIKLNQAKVQLAKNQGASLLAAEQAVDAGVVLTADQQDDMVKSGAWGQQQAIGYRAYIKNRMGEVKIERLPEVTRSVRAMVNAIPPGISADQREVAITEIQASPEYNSLTEKLKSSFDRQMAAPDSPLNSRVAKEIFQDIERRFAAGDYGDYTVTYRDPVDYQWKTKKDFRVFEDAMAKANAVEDFAAKLFENNPDITQEKANTAVQKFQEGYVAPERRNIILRSTGLTPTPASEKEKRARLDAILGKK